MAAAVNYAGNTAIAEKAVSEIRPSARALRQVIDLPRIGGQRPDVACDFSRVLHLFLQDPVEVSKQLEEAYS